MKKTVSLPHADRFFEVRFESIAPDDDAGILAGQWTHYLQEQFDAFGSGKREMPKKMKPKMKKLSPEDIKMLINYYGSFQGPAR